MLHPAHLRPHRGLLWQSRAGFAIPDVAALRPPVATIRDLGRAALVRSGALSAAVRDLGATA